MDFERVGGTGAKDALPGGVPKRRRRPCIEVKPVNVGNGGRTIDGPPRQAGGKY